MPIVGAAPLTQRRPKAAPSEAEARGRGHLRETSRCRVRSGWREAHAVAQRKDLITKPTRKRRSGRDERLQRRPSAEQVALAHRRISGEATSPLPIDVVGPELPIRRDLRSVPQEAAQCRRRVHTEPPPSRQHTVSIRTASSASLIVLSRITARRRTCAWTTAPNSCPECYETGAGSAAPTLPTSSPDRLATPRL